MLKLLFEQKIQLLIIVVLTFLAYSNIFANDFAIDDGDFIFNWPAIRDFGNIGRILTIESVPEDHAGVYRPIKAFFMMIWQAAFDSRPFGYHLFSLAVHLASTVLVYLIVRKICADLWRISADKKGRGVGFVTYVPFVTGLLFGLHPVHVEAVTFILASFDTLGVVFYLAAFLLYMYANEKRIRKRMYANKQSLRSSSLDNLGTPGLERILKVGSVSLAGLAFFTYELALTLPLALLVYDFCFGKNIFQKKKLSGLIARYWSWWAALGLYLFVRFSVLDLGSRGEYLGGSFSVTLLVMARVIVKYLEILIWPLNLSIDHEILPGVFSVVYKDYLDLKFLKSLTIFDPAILISLLILAGLLIFSLRVVGRRPIITFGILWFFVTLLPVSFIFPQSSVMAERYVYLASFGFCLTLAWLVCELYANVVRINANNHTIQPKILVILVVLVLVVGYGVRTYVRNFDWKDTLTAWTVLAGQSPRNPVANYTLGRIYAERGESDLAAEYFLKALSISPDVPEVNFRLGKIYYSKGQFDLAGQYFLKSAKEDNPRYFFQAKKELNKIEYLKSQSVKASKGQRDKWVKYTLERRVTFEYSDSWMVTEFDRGVSFDDLAESFSIEIIVDEKDSQESFESYLLRQPDHFGKLVGEGWADIPNVSGAYVKVWKDEEVDKLEFFLSEKDVVLKILVYPSSSPRMADFDRLLGSVKVNAD